MGFFLLLVTVATTYDVIVTYCKPKQNVTDNYQRSNPSDVTENGGNANSPDRAVYGGNHSPGGAAVNGGEQIELGQTTINQETNILAGKQNDKCKGQR